MHKNVVRYQFGPVKDTFAPHYGSSHHKLPMATIQLGEPLDKFRI